LIIIGLLKISFDKNKTSGLIIFLIGAFFMVPKIFEISYNFSKIFWPIILLVIGTVLIFSNKKMSNFKKKRSYVDSQFDVVNIFSGGEKIIESQDFSGANITSIFGGSEIDARTAKISGDSAEINVLTIFGGTEIHIPQDWEVKLETFSIFGAFSDERRHLTQNENKKLLIVKGFVIFGGGEINN
jgi:predicted membrane protein